MFMLDLIRLQEYDIVNIGSVEIGGVFMKGYDMNTRFWSNIFLVWQVESKPRRKQRNLFSVFCLIALLLPIISQVNTVSA